VGYTGLTGVDRVRPEASKQGTRGMIAEVVLEGSNVAVDACPLVDDISKFPYLPRGVFII
jgi:hypothetical protein